MAERSNKPGQKTLPRYASALYYHRGTSNLFLAKLNLDANSVEKIEQLESHFHGQADVDEAVVLRDICLQHPAVLEEIKKFKLPDHLTLVCDTWPYGRDSEDNLPRYVQVNLNHPQLPRQRLLTVNSATSLLEENIQDPTTTIFHYRSLRSLT